MPARTRWTLRTLAAAVAVAASAAAGPAQQVQPQVPKAGVPVVPKEGIPQVPRLNQPRNPIQVMPQINTLPGIPAHQLFRPVLEPPSWLNPATNNPWMNPTVVHPVRVPPFAVNPLFNNPFLVNPLLRNPVVNNPLNVPGYDLRFGPVPTELLPEVSVTPPVAVRQPGMMLYRGPDLQVNPWSGTRYHPQSGVVTLADGTTFYRVTGSGLPTATGAYATGTGLYYSPTAGTFFNPSSGVISRPGQTNVFVPYVW